MKQLLRNRGLFFVASIRRELSVAGPVSLDFRRKLLLQSITYGMMGCA